MTVIVSLNIYYNYNRQITKRIIYLRDDCALLSKLMTSIDALGKTIIVIPLHVEDIVTLHSIKQTS